MRRLVLLLATVGAMVALYVGAASAQTAPQGTLDANNLNGEPIGEFATCRFTWGGELDIGEHFYPQNTGRLTSAQVRLSGRFRDLSSLTGNLIMEIRGGDPSGPVLASTTIPASEITDHLEPGLFPLVTGVFSSPALVLAGRPYVLLIRSDSATCDYQVAYSLDSYLGFDAHILTGGPSGWSGYSVFDLIFATYVTPDTTAPNVDVVTPADGAQEVARGSTVTAEFSEEVQASTLTSETVQLFSGNSTKPIKAKLNVDPPTNPKSVTLTPSERLDVKNRYTVKIKGGADGVKDLVGNALDQNPDTPEDEDMVWSFTTGAR